MRRTGRRTGQLTSAALFPGTAVRYHHRDGADLATVTEVGEDIVAFVGANCDGRFTHDQIDRLIEAGRLEIVLGASDATA
ncbi:hypothetical protein [Halovivax limisalsi]|uniref:hypothetical protein n=1 Tax=Halovivax limisalsi TaxID=1453760 RepID=UPI001FFD296A|nr:hypothetical protein [Halovivax limisalsi]